MANLPEAYVSKCKEGDDDQAAVVAEGACEPVVDYLQLVAGIFEESSKRIRIAFRTFTPSGSRNLLAISGDGTRFVPSKKSFGPIGQLALNENGSRMVFFAGAVE